MKSLKTFAKQKGKDILNEKCFEYIDKVFDYDRKGNKRNFNIVLRDVELKEDIQLPNNKVIKKGSKFPRVELTPDKKLKMYKLVDNLIKPYKTILKHSLTEEMFPIVWNDDRVDGPFEPYNTNSVLISAINSISKVKEELIKLTVEEVYTLIQNLGNTFEEQVLREVIYKYMEMAGHPLR